MSNQEFRTEKDSMGELQVPVNALYGAQTQRAVNNFPISGLTVPREFIQALGLIKSSCAMTNHELGLLDKEITDAIIEAAGRVSALNSSRTQLSTDARPASVRGACAAPGTRAR